MTPIGITAYAMASSLGCDAVSSCAAARAGMVRASTGGDACPWPDEGEDLPFVVHAIRNRTRGFDGSARLVQVIAATFDDLERNSSCVDWPSTQTGIYAAFPDPRRRTRTLDLIEDPETLDRFESNIQPGERAELAMDDARRILARGVQTSDWSGSLSAVHAFGEGHTGFARALAAAAADIGQGKCEQALVGGFDTLLTSRTLSWLLATGRLKSEDNPVGLIPGEGGAICLVETVDAASRRGATTLAQLASVSFAEEPSAYETGGPPQGRGLATLLKQLAQASSASDNSQPWVMVDQNGEPYRAMDWGHALVRASHEDLHDALESVEHPAVSFGDVGAASGAFATLRLIHDFQRRHTRNRGWVVCSSDGPDRAALAWTR